MADRNLAIFNADEFFTCQAKNWAKRDGPLTFLIEHRATSLKDISNKLFSKDMAFLYNY
jgi:hypothetical protein